MSTDGDADGDLHRAVRSAFATHRADEGRIRARFDALVAAGSPRHARWGRTTARPASGGSVWSRDHTDAPTGRRRRRSTTVAVSAALAVAAVVGSTFFLEGVTGRWVVPAPAISLPSTTAGPFPESSTTVPTTTPTTGPTTGPNGGPTTGPNAGPDAGPNAGPNTGPAIPEPAATPGPSQGPGASTAQARTRPSGSHAPSATSVVPAAAPASAPVAPPRCSSSDSLAEGSFLVINNLWAAQKGTGTQCITPGAGSTAWTTMWNWSGGPGQVKSYVDAVTGWRWGSTAPVGTALPTLLSAHRGVQTHWAYALSQSRSGDLDVAYDTWFHATATPGPNTRPAAEMRVLVDKIPPGAVGPVALGTFTLDGARWQLYLNVNGWNVYSFVRSTPATTEVDLNLTDFTDTLVRLGRVSPTVYLTSVQAGADVIDGAGQLATSAYSITVH